MVPSKSFLKSTTIWGGIVMLLQWVASLMGVNLTDVRADMMLDGVLQMVGLYMIYHGRKNAEQPIHLIK